MTGHHRRVALPAAHAHQDLVPVVLAALVPGLVLVLLIAVEWLVSH